MLKNITVLDIISRSLRLLGVNASGETPKADETRDAFECLNAMLDQWSIDKLLVFCFKNDLMPLTPGQGVYTIGNGGELNTDRPVKIEKAFVRFSNGGNNTDYPMEIINNAQYQEIFIKNITTTYPKYLYYNPTYPFGTIELWPIPANDCLLMISQWSQISKFNAPADDISLPLGYQSAMEYGLAVEVAAEYGIEVPAVVAQRAVQTKAALMRVNAEPIILKLDRVLLPTGGFNILTGGYN